MARVKASLSFSTADALSYPINLTKTFTGPVDSGHAIRSKVLGTAQGADAVTIAKANDKTDVAYVYSVTLTRLKKITSTSTQGALTSQKLLGVSSHFFQPCQISTSRSMLQAVGQMIEYGVFGVDDTQAKLG